MSMLRTFLCPFAFGPNTIFICSQHHPPSPSRRAAYPHHQTSKRPSFFASRVVVCTDNGHSVSVTNRTPVFFFSCSSSETLCCFAFAALFSQPCDPPPPPLSHPIHSPYSTYVNHRPNNLHPFADTANTPCKSLLTTVQTGPVTRSQSPQQPSQSPFETP